VGHLEVKNVAEVGGKVVMTYIIAEPCVGVKDSACVDVCPVDCIYTKDEDDMFFINPEECIDCAACEPVCPVTAIFAEEATPSQWAFYTAKNYEYFEGLDTSSLQHK
jgi:ferredoxin